MAHSVLLVEDEATLAKNIERFLQREGFAVRAAATIREGRALLAAASPDVVLLDLSLPDGSGLDLLAEIRGAHPRTKVIVLTGHGTVQTAVEAMKAGAWDFVGKPLALVELRRLVGKAVEVPGVAPEEATHGGGLAEMIGASEPMLALKRQIDRLLAAERGIEHGPPPTVLVRGETGTGKELVARAVHYEGPRRNGPFVELNCSALPAQLLEGELFGHERGAFTDARERRQGLVEAANGGTLFLDEIGDLEAGVQVKLLKLLEDRTVRRLGSVREQRVDVRFITATHQPLEQVVREGRFRADLYYRLSVVTLTVPPLRERGADVLLLAEGFLADCGRRYGRPGLTLTAEAQGALLRHDWPGTVRELRNAMEQAALSADAHGRVSLPPFGLAPADPLAPPAEAAAEAAAMAAQTLPELERRTIQLALERAGGNVTRAARDLGISRDTLRYRLAKYGFDGALPGSAAAPPGGFTNLSGK